MSRPPMMPLSNRLSPGRVCSSTGRGSSRGRPFPSLSREETHLGQPPRVGGAARPGLVARGPASQRDETPRRSPPAGQPPH